MCEKTIKFYIEKEGEEYKNYGKDDDEKLNKIINKLGYDSFKYGDNIVYEINEILINALKEELKDTKYKIIKVYDDKI